ncbi:Multidrug resistance-associated protein [Blattamonas nauphoetae]|uniref:Multidrug resistance-associated protein n=1 Tax=Blattamonas nauphoetae TaxID=2049346 RepID=A0ABQ9WQG9_9EUKA|nr:Multidrug resistance-associated protein [Blattamonas nauphoetae]
MPPATTHEENPEQTSIDGEIFEESKVQLIDPNSPPLTAFGTEQNVPNIPGSPSAKTRDSDLRSPDQTIHTAVVLPPADSDPVEFKRKRNEEEAQPLIANLFFCFYFRFDIYECHTLDRTDTTITRAAQVWDTPAREYMMKRKEFESITQQEGTKAKPPKAPGLFSLIMFKLSKRRIAIYYLFIILSYVFMFLQPAMMKYLLVVVESRETDPSARFPFEFAIPLILAGFLTNFFDALGTRFIYHHTTSVRSMLSGLVYRKTLLLNITAQSNIDSGRLLSLVSTDCRMVSENMWMIYVFLLVPVQIMIPLVFVLIDFGWCGLISLGVIIVITPITMIFMFNVGIYARFFMAHNDERNKIMNETLQGMRIVKFTGLEQVFMKKIDNPRQKQITDLFHFMWFQNMANTMIRNLPMCVNAATLSTFVVTQQIPPNRFAFDVMPNVGFLTQMTRETNMIPTYMQITIMVTILLQRIRQFLLLPELQQERREEPADQDIALQIEGGNYKWADPPEIPLTSAENLVLQKERELAKKNAAKKKAEESEEELKSVEPAAELAPESQPTDSSNEIFQPTYNQLHSPSDPVANPKARDDSPPVNNVHSPSPSPSPMSTPSGNGSATTLSDINISLKVGSLTMIVGGVGSGKSSIGAAIIGDIERLSGNVKIRGSIAYCPQVPWINNDTVRGNIVFGSPFDEQKYLETVRVCALEPDFKTLSAGDQTAIGEKGVNLSGGQKARIQLARSIYSNRDIYVLDDPLSAVDAHVGRYLMDECILGKLKGKTVMLMTNQLQFLNSADCVILLHNGHVVAQGTYEELRAKGINFDKYIIKTEETKEKKEEEKEKETEEDKDENKTDNTKLDDLAKGADSEAGKQIITEEEMKTGSVPWSYYFRYLGTLFPIPLLLLFFLLVLACEAIPLLQGMWLGVIPNPNMFGGDKYYYWKIGVFGLSVPVSLVLMIGRATLLACGSKRSNRIIHNELLTNVMRCPTSFFDTTPLGRIINRFTGDLSQTDMMLLSMFMNILNMLIGVVGQIVIVSIQNIFFLCIGIPILVVFYIITKVYMRAARNLQRLDSIARSPVISLYSEVISGAGLSTIRAFGLEDVWKAKFYTALDDWCVRTVLFMEGKVWATTYTGLVLILFMGGVVGLGWAFMTPAQLSVSVNSALSFSFLAFYVVIQMVDLESKMTSYERLRFYTSNLPQETTKVEVTPPEEWPTAGNVRFDSVSFRYRHGLPFVLKDVDFEIKAGEKIGICGRTGAGKSSMLFALFRLIELDPKLEPKMIDTQTGFLIDTDPNEEPNKGRVLIDGVDISKVDLGRLRRSIAIIPQDPTLFTGTVRHNLDLASKRSDDRIWEVLDMVEMREVIANLPAGLDSEVAEGGSNFSTGQRQLLCFVRAILNNCRIVVLDEATASVDVETDEKIQKTIRQQFSDKTVIVIAHRLNTIMDSDRIIVMDKGRVVEYDSPGNLKTNPDSAFNGLIRRYKTPSFFEVMGRGLYRMWRPIGNSSIGRFPAVGNAAELGEAFVRYVVDRQDNPIEREEGEDLLHDPTTRIRNDELIKDMDEALSNLWGPDRPNIKALLTSILNMADGNDGDPWEFASLRFHALRCGFVLVDFPVASAFNTVAWGVLGVTNVAADTVAIENRAARSEHMTRTGRRSVGFGAIVTIVAASTIPTIIDKLSGLYDDFTQLLPSIASHTMPPLVTTLPAAIAPLSTIASDLDSDTLPLLTVWARLFRLDRLLHKSDLFVIESPHDSDRSSDVLFRIQMLKDFQNFTFTADVVPCDTFEGEVTLTNIQVTDTRQSMLRSQYAELETLSMLMNDRPDSQCLPEGIQNRIDDIQWLNSYLGSASHASDIANATSLLSTFKANVITHPILDEIMSEFDQTHQQSSTFTRTAEYDKCFTDLEDFKNSFASVVPGPAAYATIGPVWKRALDLTRILSYNTPWSRRELAKTVKQQIVPGNDGKSATFTLMSDTELEQLSILTDPSNFISFTSSSCNSLKNNIAKFNQQIDHVYDETEMRHFQLALDQAFRFEVFYGNENKTRKMLNTMLGEAEDLFSTISCSLNTTEFLSLIPTERLLKEEQLFRSRGRTLAVLQLGVILVYVLIIELNWTCPNNTCLCCQNLISTLYYIIFGFFFLVFAYLAVFTQDIQDAIYSDKPGLGLLPTLESSGLADQLVSLANLDDLGPSTDMIRQSLIYILQGPSYRSREEGRKEMPNPLGELLDSMLFGGIAKKGVDGMIESVFVDGKGIVSPAFKAKLAPIEQELNITLASFFSSVCDETDPEKGVFTYNFLGRSIYEIVDIVGLDVVNMLIMLYFTFNVAFLLIVPHTIATNDGQRYWPPYDRARDDPDFAKQWDEEDRIEAIQRSTPKEVQSHRLGYLGKHGHVDWSGWPQQTQTIGEADKGQVGDDELPVAPTEKEEEEVEGARLVKRRATNQNTGCGVSPTVEFSPPNPPEMKASPQSIALNKKLD